MTERRYGRAVRIAVAAFALLLIGIHWAEAGPLYGATGSNGANGELVILDPASGAVLTDVGPLVDVNSSAPYAITGIAFGILPAAGEDDAGVELMLMAVSSAIALIGIGLAAYIWLKRREIADKAAATFPGLYRLLLNKYYVDEVYDAAIVQPIRIVSQEALWRGIDVHVIDGAVNGVATIVDGWSSLLRRLQSGSVRAYAGSLFIGVVLILGYYLWR